MPFVARAQAPGRMRRVGVLTPWAANDTEAQDRVKAFVQALPQLGWTVGQNVRIENRWGDGKVDTTRKYAAELIALAPDVILALSSAALAPLLEVDRAVPIVFAGIADPVAAGYVESLSRPGGNATGFTIYEYSIGGKWLELLKEMAPHVTRVAVLRETGIAAGPGVFGAMQALAPSLGLDLRPVNVQEASDIERAITAFAQNNPRGGVVASGSPSQSRHRQVIIALAAEHRLPTVYNARFFAVAGGLISYGADFLDQSRRAAAYVDRILRGEKPADLPVQSPTKYELVINLKTAKTLGIIMPPSLLARANEVIE
jgi:putative ABC transport system substrate-binding protein